MKNLTRVGGLSEGDEFRTLHTKKMGVVLPRTSAMEGTLAAPAGVPCGFEDGERSLHPDVVVEAVVVRARIR